MWGWGLEVERGYEIPVLSVSPQIGVGRGWGKYTQTFDLWVGGLPKRAFSTNIGYVRIPVILPKFSVRARRARLFRATSEKDFINGT